jgi:hypothetical protein
MEFKIVNKASVKASKNVVYIIDVSGSMYGVLEKMKTHLKTNLTNLLSPNDSVSLIYFSGRNQAGEVFSKLKTSNKEDLSKAISAIEKLQTIGLTGFVDPIKISLKLLNELKKDSQTKENNNSLIFMTDGYDNTSSKSEILTLCEQLSQYDEITFIEYGWYCDRDLLQKMSDAVLGLHIFNEDWNEFSDSIEKAFTGSSSKIEVPTPYNEGIFAYLSQDELVTNTFNSDVIKVSDTTNNVFFFDKDLSNLDVPHDELYVMLFTAVNTMNSNKAWEILKKLGDVKFIELYNNCFSRQDYSNFLKDVKSAIIDKSLRFTQGINYNLVPDDNAYTVLDLILDLSSGENYLDLSHDEFSYERISAKTVQKDISDSAEVLKERLSNTKDINEIINLGKALSELDETPKFIPQNSALKISNIVFNESRPNISIQGNIPGVVDLKESKRAKDFNLDEVSSSITRNYTVVKDGIVNMKKLPVQLDKNTFDKLSNHFNLSNDKTNVLDISKLPLINRSMIKALSAKDFFENHLNLLSLKAKQKVFKYYLNELNPDLRSKAMLEKYGEECSKWLDSIGVRSYGFTPPVKTEKSGDFYIAKELDVKLSGSTLPAVTALLKKIQENKKLTLGDSLMKNAIDDYNNFVQTMKSSVISDKLINDWLEAETKNTIKETRLLQHQCNKTLYAIVVGKSWFSEFNSFEENSMNINFNNIDVKCEAVLKDTQINL